MGATYLKTGRAPRRSSSPLLYSGRMHAVDNGLHQLRFADGAAARKSYYYQRSYFEAIRDTTIRHSAEPTKALYAYLKAAEAHKDALYGLWNGLLHAAPFPGRHEEMRLTMARYEVVICDLHAMRMRAFDL
jgi:hypothetical protein